MALDCCFPYVSTQRQEGKCVLQDKCLWQVFHPERIPWQGTLPLTGVQVYCFHAVPGNLYSPVTEVRFIFIIFPEVKSPLEFDLSGFAYLIKRDEKNVFNVFL